MTVPKSLAETHETARIVKSRSMSRSLDPTQIVERDVDSSRLLAFYPETIGDEFFFFVHDTEGLLRWSFRYYFSFQDFS